MNKDQKIFLIDNIIFVIMICVGYYYSNNPLLIFIFILALLYGQVFGIKNEI